MLGKLIVEHRSMISEHIGSNRMIAKRAAALGAADPRPDPLRHRQRPARRRPNLADEEIRSRQWHTWTDDEIAMFEARWPKGTCERTAFALLLCTGQRRSDVVRMAWDDVDGGSIRVVQGKTGIKLSVPLHPDLQAALASWPKRGERILVTSFGNPFTSTDLGTSWPTRSRRSPVIAPWS